MSLKVPFASTLFFLTNDIAGELNNAKVRLYKTNHAPLDADVLATYTAIEATFGGYPAGGILINDWGAAFLNAGNQAQTTAGVKTFTATGAGLPQTIYGVFVVDGGGNLLYAELNPTGGVVLTNAGDTFSYQPVFTDESKF